jgi:hypothetical protein
MLVGILARLPSENPLGNSDEKPTRSNTVAFLPTAGIFKGLGRCVTA